ncbi:monovalent cation:H+ antiporter, CPA1 (nhx1), variant 2 [Balamuthia mandrillaris]
MVPHLTDQNQRLREISTMKRDPPALMMRALKFSLYFALLCILLVFPLFSSSSSTAFASPSAATHKEGGEGEQQLLSATTASGATSRKLQGFNPIPETPEQAEESELSFTFLLLIALLIVCFLSAYILSQIQPVKYLHETGAAILFGALIGAFIRFFTDIERLKSIVKFKGDFFFLFLLPPIIFESGYTMKKSQFFKSLDSILAFAFLGTVLTAFVFGIILYGAIAAGLAEPLSFVECLVFGSLLSATDPVTTLAIFKELSVPNTLYAIVFGESVLNDAVAIVLFRSMVALESRPVSLLSAVLATADFFFIFIASTVCGVVIALFCSLLLKYTQLYKYQSLEVILQFLYAFSSYLLADGLGLSGIVSILFCGATMAHYTYWNLSKSSKVFSERLYTFLASAAEMFVFAYLGLALFSFEQTYDFGLIFFSLVGVLVTRVIHVLSMSGLVNLIRGRITHNPNLIDAKQQFILWLAGLRGAIAFALSLDGSTQKSDFIHTTTLFVVLVTVLALGGMAAPGLLWTGMGKVGKRGSEHGEEEEEEDEQLEGIVGAWWYRFDNRSVSPFFFVCFFLKLSRE